MLTLALSAFLISYIGTGLSTKYNRNFGLLDQPNARSSHALPLTTGGGLSASVVGLLVVFTLTSKRLLPLADGIAVGGGGALLGFLGFADDRRHISAGMRLLAQFLVAIALVSAILDHTQAALRDSDFHSYAVSCGLVLTVVWFINLFNFMDGIDGLAGAEAAFLGASMAWLNWSNDGSLGVTIAFISLSSAMLGFLRWNWPPAKIFMGNVGSACIGFLLVALGLVASSTRGVRIECFLILSGIFISDATITLLRRFIRRERWYEAHRDHAYQRLARRMGRHLPVTGAAVAINLFWLLPWAWAANESENSLLYATIAFSPLIAAAVVMGAGTGSNTTIR